MSSQRGNVKRSRPQKHQNRFAFKNTLHDTSKKTQTIVNTDVSGICARCKEVIDWKIKYKKYKPLTVPKKCVKCQQKAVKKAYYIMCDQCATKEHLCGKCGKNKDIVMQPRLSAAEEACQQSRLEQELKMLPERKRRTFQRLQASGKFCETEGASGSPYKDEDKDHDSFDDESSGYEDEDCEFDTESSTKDEEAALTTLKLIESRKKAPVLFEKASTTETDSDLPENSSSDTAFFSSLQAVESNFTDTTTSSDNIII